MAWSTLGNLHFAYVCGKYANVKIEESRGRPSDCPLAIVVMFVSPALGVAVAVAQSMWRKAAGAKQAAQSSWRKAAGAKQLAQSSWRKAAGAKQEAHSGRPQQVSKIGQVEI